MPGKATGRKKRWQRPTEAAASPGATSAGKPDPRFQPGKSGNPAGRKPGVPNKATIEVKVACRALVEDEDYRKRLASRLKSGDLPPAVETMLWHYAYGKPKETVGLEGPDGGPIPVTLIERLIVKAVK